MLQPIAAALCCVARSAALLALTGAGAVSLAQTQSNVQVPARGTGSFGVTYQQISISERELVVVRENFGKVTLRSAYFEVDYGLTDRLALSVTLPLKSNRYVGDFPHDTRLLANDHGEEFLDDGDYHTNWGDLGVGVRWLWRQSDRLALTPFVGYYTPSNEYPLFTETQAGTGQWRFDAGLNAAGRIGAPGRNLYWQAGYAYSYLETTRPSDAPSRRVNRSHVSFELGWNATPRLMPYVTLTYNTTHGAIELTEFRVPLSPELFATDEFYYHDQLLPWEQRTWAVGTRYLLSKQVNLHMSYGRSGKVDFGHFYEPAFTFGFSRGFSRNGARSR
jgi:hypothetical protein